VLIAKYQPDHVVVKLYQTIESIPQNYSRDQIASAQAAGCTVAGYVWLYADSDPRAQIRDVVALAKSCGLTGVLWIDVEPYIDHTIPTVDQVSEALDECRVLGVKAGIYSGEWVFEQCFPGITSLAQVGIPIWVAEYNGVSDLLTVTAFGGWRQEMIWGHQYSADTIDLNVFLPSACY
jgi:hypothetical protein